MQEGEQMLAITLITLFLVGYALIAIESLTGLDKGATALLTGFALFAAISLGGHHPGLEEHLAHTTREIAEIILFLLGAMTIVEMVSLCGGFDLIARKIASRSKRKLLLIVSAIAFFMSAVLDNLTTAIVMYTIVTKLVEDKEDRMIFAGIIIIAANSGGAWSPVGDVTTTMLWIAGKVSALKLVTSLFLPSLISLTVPLLLIMKHVNGTIAARIEDESDERNGAKIILAVGFLGIISVPLVKATLHLPPYLCMLGALGVLWVAEEILYKGKAWINVSQADATEDESGHTRRKKTLAKALESVEIPSLLFFIGILLAVNALESEHLLTQGAELLNRLCEANTVVKILGVISALLDNVPLTAAAIKMYREIASDSLFWHMLALCVGTGGSLLIIGSAAGVVLMDKAKITFGWYLKRFTLPILAGYAASIMVLLLSNR